MGLIPGRTFRRAAIKSPIASKPSGAFTIDAQQKIFGWRSDDNKVEVGEVCYPSPCNFDATMPISNDAL